jgi:dethiobiotin synthetase
MSHAYFLTGTDTEIGKTFITCALLHRARQLGLTAAGLKPVAAGTDAAGNNEDVEAIRAAANVTLPRQDHQPLLFHTGHRTPSGRRGGWRQHRFRTVSRAACSAGPAGGRFSDRRGRRRILRATGRRPRQRRSRRRRSALPVILVVGLRLGCINHALLTAEAIAARGLALAGWVANRIDPEMARADDNIATLSARLAAPLLGSVPRIAGGDPADGAAHLALPADA